MSDANASASFSERAEISDWEGRETERRKTPEFRAWMAYGRYRRFRIVYEIVSRTRRHTHALGGQEDWESFGLNGDLALLGALPQLAQNGDVGMLADRRIVLPDDFTPLHVRLLVAHTDSTYGELAAGQELEVAHNVGEWWLYRGIAEPSSYQVVGPSKHATLPRLWVDWYDGIVQAVNDYERRYKRPPGERALAVELKMNYSTLRYRLNVLRDKAGIDARRHLRER